MDDDWNDENPFSKQGTSLLCLPGSPASPFYSLASGFTPVFALASLGSPSSLPTAPQRTCHAYRAGPLLGEADEVLQAHGVHLGAERNVFVTQPPTVCSSPRAPTRHPAACSSTPLAALPHHSPARRLTNRVPLFNPAPPRQPPIHRPRCSAPTHPAARARALPDNIARV